MAKIVTLSAPGKILVAGGYLVLESPNVGIVLAADKKFHTTVTELSEASVIDASEENDVDLKALLNENSSFSSSSILDVHSPQYNTIFSYYLLINKDPIDNESPLLKIIPRNKKQSPNPFIERTLILTFSYILASSRESAIPKILGIKLLADNDFYSQVDTLRDLQKMPPTPLDVESLPPFLPAGEHKTGMGSSAALVTSLVASLLYYFDFSCTQNEEEEVEEITSSLKNKQLLSVHNLAQIAHSLAQGKIGSGFDVSAAVYGSQVYTRFSTAIIKPLMDTFSSSTSDDETAVSFGKDLRVCVDETEWDTKALPFSLPDGFQVIMADVCGGSESPSMARAVLKWKKEYQAEKASKETGPNDDEDDVDADDDYWHALMNINTELCNLFSDLQLMMHKINSPSKKDEIFQFLNSSSAEKWVEYSSSPSNNVLNTEIINQILNIREAFLESRSNLKAMGEVASVPIEPEEQTVLADATMDIPGVIAAGVPGAGGVDAIFCLYVEGEKTSDDKSDSVRDSIANLWATWEKEDGGLVVPMGVRAINYGEGLEVNSDMQW